MTAEASLAGYAPVVTVGPAVMTEQQKYERMWKHPQYRAVAPGEHIAEQFIKIAKPGQGAEVIDFGSGTGRGALMLAVLGNLRVHMTDFAANCLDEDVRHMLTTQPQALSFQQHDLTKSLGRHAPYGFCTDVMEHIPPEQVDGVLTNILQAAQHVFFQIACNDDVCGALIGAPLHLSVHDHAWWLRKLQDSGAVVHWSEDCGTHCCFYVTGWMVGEEFQKQGRLNVEEQQILDNVRANLTGGWNEASPHVTNDLEVMILAGGPSLANHELDIHRLRKAGAKLVTLNGTYNWALDHGLKPSAQVVLDARAFNKRFVSPQIDACAYLISSQCHPEVLEGLPKDRTWLWHTTMESIREEVNGARKTWWGVPGGSTVMLRAIPLLRMLGYKKFHLFGFDSCLQGDAHHAYSQPENNDSPVIAVTCGERVFHCHPWMCQQAQQFQELIKFLGDELDLEVYGDGLIAHMLNTGARLADSQLIELE